MNTNCREQSLTFSEFMPLEVAVSDQANRSDPGGPLPLWWQARTRARAFRPDELVRTHWRKVWRTMVAE